MSNNTYMASLCEAMTLEEKIELLHGATIFKTGGIKRLGIPPLVMSDGPMGVRQSFGDASWVPSGGHDDYVTAFPCNSALAATWNKALAFAYGDALGAEARGRGKDIILAPGVNIIRTPLCGRNFEYMSEDPYLTGEMAVPLIKGIQQNDVAACIKHFALNNQETNRLYVNVEVDDRALFELYLPAFHRAVTEAKVASIMAAYNLYRGDYCCASKRLLTDILRSDWQFEGVVISDWGAAHSCKESIEAGLDIEMSVSTDFDHYWFAETLYRQVNDGTVDVSLVDQAVMRILLMMDRLHMLDNPGTNEENTRPRQSGTYNHPKHQQVALQVANEANVLLHNNNQLLPLNKNAFQSIAIIGENADKIHCNEGGSAEVKALFEITPLAGIKMTLGGNHKITYAKGYTSEVDANNDKLNYLMEEALKIASSHDVVIFIGGLNHDHDTEGKDRDSLTLPYQQDRLIKALYQVNAKMVVVNIAGSAVDLSTATNYSGALIHSWYNGMHAGTALAKLLFGDISPSGKLPISFPKQLTDCSAHSIGAFPGNETVSYTEGIYVGYRHYATNNIVPQYAFGHGLSYTHFTYSDLTVISVDDSITVKVQLLNSGDCYGQEVVQVYVREMNPTIDRPVITLVAFEKVALEPNESCEVVMTIQQSAFGYYATESEKWVTNKGLYTIMVGSASDDLRLEHIMELR